MYHFWQKRYTYYWQMVRLSRTYSLLPITRTLVNLNLASTQTIRQLPLDFLYTFIVILPSVPQTLDSLSLLLTRSSFCFPSDHFYIILPTITQTIFWEHDKSDNKKQFTEVRNIEFFSKQPRQFFVFTFLSLQFKFSELPCIINKLSCLIPFSKYQFTHTFVDLEVKCA